MFAGKSKIQHLTQTQYTVMYLALLKREICYNVSWCNIKLSTYDITFHHAHTIYFVLATTKRDNRNTLMDDALLEEAEEEED